MMTYVRRILFLAALISYAALNYVAWTRLTPGAGGLAPFDLRVTGYSAQDVTDYLAVLTPDALAAYQGPIAAIDTFFPVALTLWLWSLAVGGRRIAYLGAVVVAGYLAADLMENAAVQRLLTTPMLVDPDLAARASLLTVLKFASLAVGAVLVFWGRGRRA